MKKAGNTTRGKLKTATPVERAKPWNALVVKLGTGYTYLLPRRAIEKDYADFLIEQERFTTRGIAQERARAEDMRVWFNDQYDVDDVRAQGHVITEPTYEEMQQMLLDASSIMCIDTVKEVFL